MHEFQDWLHQKILKPILLKILQTETYVCEDIRIWLNSNPCIINPVFSNPDVLAVKSQEPTFT